ncbi:hypothetical protein MC885_014750 [Smutsia gigantea]|nr:hypothetical protein MC885_014750 [Smutsia gigantea]
MSCCLARKAAVASPSPTPGHYHAFHRGHGETQVSWHGETYCLLGGYWVYGDAPLATPAKVEAVKPFPRLPPKRHRTWRESVEELGCPCPKIRQLQHSGKRLTPQELAGRAPMATPAKVEAEKPFPRRPPKRHQTSTESDEELRCPRPKIRQLQHSGKRLTPQKLAR